MRGLLCVFAFMIAGSPSWARSPECPLSFERVFGELIDLDSKIGIVADPPRALGDSSIGLTGKASGGWITYRRSNESGAVTRVLERRSGDELERWVFEGECQSHFERFPQSARFQSGDGDFDSRRLRELLSTSGQGLIYIFSPALPLSVEGIEVVRAIARELGLPLTVLMDPTSSRAAHLPPSEYERATAAEFEILGGRNHYPALFVYHSARITSKAWIGLRPDSEYRAIIKREFARKVPYSSPDQALAAAERVHDSLAQIRFVADREFELIRTIPIPEREFGNSAFFQLLPFHPYVLDYSYVDQYRVYLIHQQTGELTRLAPTGGDPYPLPDGQVVMMPPTRNSSRMDFFLVEDLLSKREYATPFFTATERETFWYATAGVTENGELRVISRYGSFGLNRYRYELVDGKPRIESIGERVEVCANMPSSAPVLSRDGRLIAATSEIGFAVYEIPEDLAAPCPLRVEIPFRTFKSAWDPYSSDRVAFAVNDSDNYLFEISSRTLVKLPTRIEGCAQLTSPRIVGPDLFLFVCRNAQGKRHAYVRMAR